MPREKQNVYRIPILCGILDILPGIDPYYDLITGQSDRLLHYWRMATTGDVPPTAIAMNQSPLSPPQGSSPVSAIYEGIPGSAPDYSLSRQGKTVSTQLGWARTTTVDGSEVNAVSRYTVSFWLRTPEGDTDPNCVVFRQRVKEYAASTPQDIVDALIVTMESTAGRWSNIQMWIPNNSAGLGQWGWGTTFFHRLNGGISGGAARDAWHHIACVIDGGTARLYYNGTQVATSSCVANALDLQVARVADDNLGADARIDEVCVWKRALSAAEIAAQHSVGLAL